MTMPGSELPPYPKIGGATVTRLRNARKQYKASSESIDKALATTERGFEEAFKDADSRAATRDRIKAAADKNRDISRLNHR
ncbi:hypothetical protein [Microbacterium terrisoli]|uniref:hypothetical protein n=1 Tax=Microbacterium terrisoli TaxID=3242192 RepID=UPI0028043710|nr:hypothetical protein [Microbacterium protaetiae]